MKIAVLYHSETGNTEKLAGLVAEGAESVDGVSVKTMSVENPDTSWIGESSAVIFGSPTYWGGVSWQMKRFFDAPNVSLGGKIAGFFSTMNWTNGGGAEVTILTMIPAALVHGMLCYSGGTPNGRPPVHIGAVAEKAPSGEFEIERAKKLGINIAEKAVELFG